MFNPAAHQSVFHQITLLTRVMDQLTPQMTDIPIALVLEAFIYNKTRRTLNFKYETLVPHVIPPCNINNTDLPLNRTKDRSTFHLVLVLFRSMHSRATSSHFIRSKMTTK